MTEAPRVASRVVGSGLSGSLCSSCTEHVDKGDQWPNTVLEAFLGESDSTPGECLHVVMEDSLPEGRSHLDVECVDCIPELRYTVSEHEPRIYCARSCNLRKWRTGYMYPPMPSPST